MVALSGNATLSLAEVGYNFGGSNTDTYNNDLGGGDGLVIQYSADADTGYTAALFGLGVASCSLCETQDWIGIA